MGVQKRGGYVEIGRTRFKMVGRAYKCETGTRGYACTACGAIRLRNEVAKESGRIDLTISGEEALTDREKKITADIEITRGTVIKGGRFPGGMITFMLVIGSRAR